MAIQVGLSQRMKSEIRGMRDAMQDELYRNVKKALDNRYSKLGASLYTSQQIQALYDMQDFLESILIKRALITSQRQYD